MRTDEELPDFTDEQARQEFDKAIAQGRLSLDTNAANYAEFYMFMGLDDDGKPLFKHYETRSYID